MWDGQLGQEEDTLHVGVHDLLVDVPGGGQWVPDNVHPSIVDL